MANAPHDQNRVFSKLAVLNTDLVQGQHLVTIKINPLNNGIKINTTDTISFVMQPVSPHDENWQKCWLFQGSIDGLAYPAVANAAGELLVDM